MSPLLEDQVDVEPQSASKKSIIRAKMRKSTWIF